MAEIQTGKLRCLAACWAVGGLLGVVAMVLVFLLGEFSSAQAIFSGGLLTVFVGLLLQVVLCRSLPAPGNVVIPGTQSSVSGTHYAAASPVAADRVEVSSDAVASSEPAYDHQEAAEAEPTHPQTPVEKVEREAVADPEPVLQPEPDVSEPAASEPEPEVSQPVSATPAGEASKPQMLDAPRDGGADDLKKIKGVGPKLEKMLNGMGIYHFDQIASWKAEELAWVDENLEGFKGRASRDNWVSQSQTLSGGGETDFSNKVDKGDVY
ncbi:hypothetical protein AAD018_010920 [Aestuariibius insulae]|uniref:hypothetical protein n=1 Tax=Aestuariibius insulae TaxID=2058287 RepID=UPI00345E3B07